MGGVVGTILDHMTFSFLQICQPDNFMQHSSYFCITYFLSATFNYLKDAAICVKYLNDVCDNDETCSLLHPENHTPYLWQYKKPNENSWKKFPNNLNDEIEKAFCNPMQSRYE